jgi:hypothetical protein
MDHGDGTENGKRGRCVNSRLDICEAYRRAKVFLHVNDQQCWPELGVGHVCGCFRRVTQDYGFRRIHTCHNVLHKKRTGEAGDIVRR